MPACSLTVNTWSSKYLLHLEEHGEVPDLVRQLVAEDGEAGAEAAHVAVSEGRPDGETVRQVVDPVPADNLGNILTHSDKKSVVVSFMS